MSLFYQVFFNSHYQANEQDLQGAIYENIKQIFKSEASFVFDNKTENNELLDSHLCYGLEDMSLLSRLNTGEHIALRVKEKIIRFEPRIKNVFVQFETEDHTLNTMNFLIYGDVTQNNITQALVLDTNVSLTNLDVSISDEILND